MKIKNSLLLLLLLFSTPTFANNAPVIEILIDNPNSIPFMFINNNYTGNICNYLNANKIQCTINNKSVLGYILNISLVNKKNPNCSVNLTLFGGDTQYLFQLTSAYQGSSFNPMQWDGKRNLVAHLIIGDNKCVSN